MSEIEVIQEALKEDWHFVAYDGVDGFDLVDRVEGENRRWQRRVGVVLKSQATGKHYMFEYEQGLTESQENELYSDDVWEVSPVEVKAINWEEVI